MKNGASHTNIEVIQNVWFILYQHIYGLYYYNWQKDATQAAVVELSLVYLTTKLKGACKLSSVSELFFYFSSPTFCLPGGRLSCLSLILEDRRRELFLSTTCLFFWHRFILTRLATFGKKDSRTKKCNLIYYFGRFQTYQIDT